MGLRSLRAWIQLYDTDGDGFGDNAEVVNDSDPNDPASVPPGEPTIDTDGDGLTDTREAKLGTDPQLADSDADGLTDFAEVGISRGPPPAPIRFSLTRTATG